METSNFPLKRKSSDEEVRDTLHRFIEARKKAKIEETQIPGAYGECSSGPASKALEDPNKNKAFIVRISPHSIELPTAQFNHKELNNRLNDYEMRKSEDNDRHPFFLQNMSFDDDDNEPRRLFTLYDIKNDDTSKSALDAKRRLRYTNVHGLICPQEKMFLTTACDYFLADYDDLIDYIDAIGEMRNKQIIVEHCYYKLFMHTLKMFYYTDKGWRFNLEFDEFFSGYLRKYREPIINQMKTNYNNGTL
ncbi:unnamed protein product [Caenorhabditis brenneri]